MSGKLVRHLVAILIIGALGGSCMASDGVTPSPDIEIQRGPISLRAGPVSIDIESARVGRSYSTHYIMRYPPDGFSFYELRLKADGLSEPQEALAWVQENLHLAAGETRPDLYHSGWIIVGEDIEYRVEADFDYRYVLTYAIPERIPSEGFQLVISDGRTVALGSILQTPQVESQGGSEELLGTVLSGADNRAPGPFAAVCGGSDNGALAVHSAVGGGQLNQATASHAVVAGGRENQATYFYATIGGGYGNLASGRDATVAGGSRNGAQGTHASVGGGIQNQALATDARIGGGSYNRAEGIYATVGGGTRNLSRGHSTYIGGGSGNLASGDHSAIVGGLAIEASGVYAAAGGGYGNLVTGDYAAIPGGAQNRAAGDYSVAMGRGAEVRGQHQGTLLFSDSSGGRFPSASENEFAVRATGGVRFVTAVDPSGSALAGVQLPAGGGSWSMASSRELKSDLQAVNGVRVLEGLIDLPLYRWRYRAQDAGVSHMGPMAEDFYSIFGLGADSKHIDAIDADGVALVAIQALHGELQESEARLSSQAAEIEELRDRIADLEHGQEGGGGIGIGAAIWTLAGLILGLQVIRVRMGSEP